MRKYLAIVACAIAVTSCSFGASTVDQEVLEKEVAVQLTPEDGSAEATADCQGDLDAKVDATQDCTVTVGEQSIDVTVTVTKVDGGDVEFDIE